MILDAAHALRICLCERLDETIGGPVCRCSLMPGTTPTADFCGDDLHGHGQASVNIVRTFLYQDFPDPLADTLRCSRGKGAELLMTVYRCAPGIKDDGTPPNQQELDDAVAVLMDDQHAMMCAVECCFSEQYSTLVIGEWTPVEPSGGCMGGSMSVTVAVPRLPCPEVGS